MGAVMVPTPGTGMGWCGSRKSCVWKLTRPDENSSACLNPHDCRGRRACGDVSEEVRGINGRRGAELICQQNKSELDTGGRT